MQELSNKVIQKYNYTKAKEFVDNELFRLKHLGIKLMCLIPPNAGRQISLLDKVDGTLQNGSKQEKYVEKKDYLEKEIQKELEKHSSSLGLLTKDEKKLFEEMYINQNCDYDIEEKLVWSHSKVLHLRKSFIIKIALSMGMDFEK